MRSQHADAEAGYYSKAEWWVRLSCILFAVLLITALDPEQGECLKPPLVHSTLPKWQISQ